MNDRAKIRLDSLSVKYEEEKNPLYAWEAWKIVSDFNMPIPIWLAEYFDQSAIALLEIGKTKYERGANEIIQALGFASKGGDLSSFNKAGCSVRDDLLAAYVSMKLSSGIKEYIAIEDVARERECSKATVRRAFKKVQTIAINNSSPNYDLKKTRFNQTSYIFKQMCNGK